jgi:pyruvate dehydrogenase E1 component alpha subunit
VSKKNHSTLDLEQPAKGKAGKLAQVNTSLSPEKKIEIYSQMVRIRRFEERSIRCYQQGKIGGFCHTYIGQEAVAVGSISVLGEDDQIITAYRDHAHALAVGMSMNELMAEMFGKFTGCSKGKGGSMHFFAPDKRFWGGHGIVGGQTPLGAGLAFALKYLEKKACCLCYLGDGAVNQGAFHEALNLAALWKLPVIYIIENNYYSMGTSQPRSSAGNPLAKRALGYDMDYDVVDGNDVYLVREKTAEAVKRAKEESLPTVLEFKTYRYRGHSMSDPETYRTKEEVEEKKKTDPIQIFQSYLVEEGVLDDEKIKEIDEAAKKEAADSNDFAEESPFPPAEELFTDVYVNDKDYLAKNQETI